MAEKIPDLCEVKFPNGKLCRVNVNSSMISYTHLLREPAPVIQYHEIFEHLCNECPEKAEEYKLLLKMYDQNYRTAVILIEYENLKNENKMLREILQNG